MLFGQCLRLVVQAAYFVIIARSLGVNQYGAFAAAVAMIAILSPFSSLGTGNLLVKNVAADRNGFPQYWGNCLSVTVISGSGLVMFALAACRLALPPTVTLMVVLLVALSDLFFAKLLEAASLAFQAFEMLDMTARLNILMGLARLAAALPLLLLRAHAQVVTWAALYLASSAIGALAAVFVVRVRLGKADFSRPYSVKELREGLLFSFSLSSQTVYNDIDKSMLARMATLSAVGVYAAAYRVVDVSFIPVRSLLFATYPRFFKHGVKGLQSTASYALRCLTPASAYGAGIFLVLIGVAPILPRILGPEYHQMIEAIRWLAPLPLLRAVHYLFADSLTGAGHQGWRIAAQAGVAAFNVGCNLWLIPLYSWRGAAWASLASDALLAASLGLMTWMLLRSQSRRQTITVAQPIQEIS